jgi:hypothetical protein
MSILPELRSKVNLFAVCLNGNIETNREWQASAVFVTGRPPGDAPSVD